MLIERLRREIAMVDIARNGIPTPDPADDDRRAEGVPDERVLRLRRRPVPVPLPANELGKLIGKRSWGGVVGIRGSLPLVDGGTLNRPEFSRYDIDGKKWIIEGHGVDPDIVVDNDPAKEFAGEDEQLNQGDRSDPRGIEEEGKDAPPVPPYPKKNP